MNPRERISNLVKTEREFLAEKEAEINEHGVYYFVSKNGLQHISLDHFLLEYKEWLIEKGQVKNQQQ